MTAPILPQIDEVNRTFWEGCRERELRLQRCSTCRRLRYPPAPVCSNCPSMDVEWETVSGRGAIFSFVVFRLAYHPARGDRVPDNVALVELEEGPRMIGNVVDVDPGALRVGQPVRAVFEAVTDDVSLPKFRLEE